MANTNNWFKKIIIIVFWLLIWQVASMVIHNTIILVGPTDVLVTLFRLVPSSDFWRSLSYSFGKISIGFFSGFLLGILIGSISYGIPFIQDMLNPVILLMKSVPVASFVILALVWAGSSNLSVIISFLVVFPVIYVNTVSGLGSTDAKLLEMARVFRIPLWKRMKFIYRPALFPYLINGCQIALGMSWKSGIAAEVIGIPAHSIGENLYMSKIYLETSSLFAWTLVIIIISALFEKLFLLILTGFNQNH